MAPLSTTYRTAFLTGASSGLGFAFAEMLLAEGIQVWGTARDAARLQALAARPGFHPVTLDLADADAARSAYSRAAAEAGGAFDLVINNAGYGVFAPFEVARPEAWREQLNVLLTHTLLLSQRAYADLRAQNRGTLVNVSSLAAEFPIPYMSAYNVAKAGLSALSESLLFEARDTPVKIIDFRPGDYRTQFNQAMSRSPDFPAPAAHDHSRPARAWRAIDALLLASPPPAKAARDLRAALACGHSGIVRSGTFFQATLAPFFARFLPLSLRRAIAARYYGVS